MESKYLYDGEGVKDIPPQNMLLWSIDYFQLKALEKQQLYYILPFSSWKQETDFPMWKMPSMHQEEINIFITRDEDFRLTKIYINRPC